MGPCRSTSACCPTGTGGSRAFAEMKSVDEGHRTGAETLSRLVQWCDDLEIPVITIWVLSTDNFERPAEELAGIFGLVEEGIGSLLDAQSQSAGRGASARSAVASSSRRRPSRRSSASSARRRSTAAAS